jgi:hypothetical protein
VSTTVEVTPARHRKIERLLAAVFSASVMALPKLTRASFVKSVPFTPTITSLVASTPQAGVLVPTWVTRI